MLRPGGSGSGGTSRVELTLASAAEEGVREPAEKHRSLTLPPAVSPASGTVGALWLTGSTMKSGHTEPEFRPSSPGSLFSFV